MVQKAAWMAQLALPQEERWPELALLAVSVSVPDPNRMRDQSVMLEAARVRLPPAKFTAVLPPFHTFSIPEMVSEPPVTLSVPVPPAAVAEPPT